MDDAAIPKREELSDEISDMFPPEEIEQPLDLSSIKNFIAQDSLSLQENIKATAITLDKDTLDPKFIQECTFRLLAALDFYAKRHNKEWAANYGYHIRTHRELEMNGPIGWYANFNIFKYYINLVKIDDPSEIKNIAFNEPTAMDARIYGAVKLGFNSSVYYIKALRTVPKDTGQVILNDLSYLRNAKQFLWLSEKKKQILQFRGKDRKYVKIWLERVEEELKQLALLTTIKF
jgi:hypothetical protein